MQGESLWETTSEGIFPEDSDDPKPHLQTLQRHLLYMIHKEQD